MKTKLLISLLVLLAILIIYYFVNVYIPAQEQAALIRGF